MPERSPTRLDPDEYRRLCEQVLERDAWRCQFCGRREYLHVHHIHFRSRGGDDVEENLIVLCFSCHRAVHDSAPAKI
jgi:5-methylcytosine-specific restriction endonuclease McrA